MTKLKINIANPMSLAECPIGLFYAGHGALCVKTEYGDNDGRIDAYIIETGEMFWGGAPQTAKTQRCEIVFPVRIVE